MMIGLKPLTALAVTLSATSSLVNAEFLNKEFDDFTAETLKLHHVVGASVSVVDGNATHSKGYGYAVLPNTAATPQTKWFTGSTTKAMVGAIAAHFVHDTKNYSDLTWKTHIVDVLREDFVLDDEWATTHTTLEDALSHRTGLPTNDEFYGQDGDTPSKIVKRLRYLPLSAEPRTTFQYCNPMFVVVQDFLQKLSGRPLESMLEEILWKPLGMQQTTWSLPKAKASQKLARGYFWNASDDSDSAQGNYVPDKYINIIPLGGAGATISTTEDYSLWIRALLSAIDPAQTNSSSPVSNAMITDQISPRISTGEYDMTIPGGAARPASYGLGWFTMDILGEAVVTHSGGVVGFTTQVFLIPSKNFGFAIMCNSQSVRAITTMAAKLIADKIIPDSYSPAARAEAWTKIQSQMHLKPKDFPQTTNSTQKPHAVRSAPKQIPLLSSLADLAGSYHHGAYGTLNFTNTADSLIAYMSDRTWPEKLVLKHQSALTFSFEQYYPHGLHDIRSKDIAWELTQPATRGVFEFGGNGEQIERLGLEFDPDAVAAAAAKGDKYWAEGMIWFDRV